MARLTLINISSAASTELGREKISNLSLQIGDREFVTLLGPRGCGASSLIRMIAGLEQPDSGEILLDERRLNDLSPKDRDVALVPPRFKPYLSGSVHENLVFPLKMRSRSQSEVKKRVEGAAELVGVQGLLGRATDTLSAEERQRLAIARAIAIQPKLLLFDHALSDLESDIQFRLRDQIRKLYQRLQITIIFATDNPGEALAIGERIVVMNEGVSEQAENARTAYENPANIDVAQILSGMNLVSGSLKQDRDRWIFSERDEGTIKINWPSSAVFGDDLAGKPVIMGILPENIEILASQGGHEKSGDSFPAIVDLAESMGPDLKVRLQTGAHSLTVISRLTNDLPSPGRRARLRINPDKICLFDPHSRHRLDGVVNLLQDRV